MTRQSVREYLARQRGRYVAAPRAERGRLLDEIAAVTGYHRKAIIRALGAGRPPARGRAPHRHLDPDNPARAVGSLLD